MAERPKRDLFGTKRAVGGTLFGTNGTLFGTKWSSAAGPSAGGRDGRRRKRGTADYVEWEIGRTPGVRLFLWQTLD